MPGHKKKPMKKATKKSSGKKSKNENFLIGNNKTFLLAKIDINESVIKIVTIISKILLEKYLNLNNINCNLVIAVFLLKRS